MNYQRNYVQNLINGFMSTLVIYTSCELGIFDRLSNGSKTMDELEADLDISKEELLRIIRPLKPYNLLDISEEKVSLSEIGKLLVSDDEAGLGPYALFCGRESLAAWSNMCPALKNKKSPRELLSQSSLFQAMDDDEEQFKTFNGMMSAVSRQLDLSPFFKHFLEKDKKFTVADIGGGTGTIISKFLHFYENSEGMILDLPQAKTQAIENIKEAGLLQRCSFKQTDFFEGIKVSADVFILSRVLHDWGDEDSGRILKNVAEAMTDGSKLLIMEDLVRKSDEPNALRSYMNDIQMWVFCNGKERTVNDFERLFARSGLKLESIFEIEEGTSVLTVRKENEEEGEI